MARENPAGEALDPLRFAEKLLALLGSGRFTATYKFATLAALIDICVESVDPSGVPARAVSARQVGRRVLELFWRHAVPYTADTEKRYLRHSTQAADLVSRVSEFREHHRLPTGMTIDAARQQHAGDFASLENHVIETVIRMPLPKLQRFGTGSGVQEDRFLYDYGWPDEVPVGRIRATGFDDTLHLRPGVAEWLVRLAGVLRPIVEQRWAAFVADRSRDVVDAAYLDDFLFGSSRIGLGRVRDPLLDAQHGTCFYCGAAATRAGTEVDHFIPWSRHPDNGLHNLVVAHRRCNNAKRDSLASAGHLRRWVDRFQPNAAPAVHLVDLAADLRWPIDASRALGTARATYLWLPAGTLLWEGPGGYSPADPVEIRSALRAPAHQ